MVRPPPIANHTAMRAQTATERRAISNVLDKKARDKYKFVFEDTAHFDRAQGLSMTELALAGMKSPPDGDCLRQ